MNPELTTIWNRWLEGRLLDSAEVNQLVAALDGDDPVADPLYQDLDIHRLLLAAAERERNDLSFVQRMVDCYDRRPSTRTLPPAGSANPSFQWLVEATGTRPQTAPATGESAGGPLIQMVVTPSGVRRSAVAKRQWHYLSVAASLALLTATLATVWWMNSNSPGRSPRAEQLETPAPGPRNAHPDPSLPVSEPGPDQSPAVDGPALAAAEPAVAADSQPAGPVVKEPRPGNPLWQSRQLTPRDPPNATFAGIRELQPCDWADGPDHPDRVGVETLRLRSGVALIDLDQGGSFTVTGPSQLTLAGPGQLELVRGRLDGELPDFDRGELVIQTPDSRIQPQHDSRFALHVPSDDQLDVRVDQGAIEVQPWQARVVDDTILLSDAGFNRVQIDAAGQNSPARARFRTPQGQFEGWVNVHGKSLKSRDEHLVDEVFARASDRFREAPEQLDQEWNNLLSMIRSVRSPKSAGPGPDRIPAELDDFVRQMQEMMKPAAPFASESSARAGAFEGVLNINGQEMRFDSQQAFDAAQRDLLGSFADLFDQFHQ